MGTTFSSIHVYSPYEINNFPNFHSFSAGWQTKPSGYVVGYRLKRRVINKMSYEYILDKSLDGHSCSHRIDPHLQKTHEYRRILFALRNMAHNPVRIVVDAFKDHVHLKMRVYLPDEEHACLETFAWPHHSIMDRLEWDMDNDTWEYIRKKLLCLDVEIEETQHG